MHHFTDQGIILRTRPHGETGAIISILSENHGKWVGYVNGARSSQRLRAILQPGNTVAVEWQAKAHDQMGRFDPDSSADIVAAIMDDHNALLSVQSLCALADMFLPEREPHPHLFHGSCGYLNLLKETMWPAAYVMWEMAFLKELGYGIDLGRCAVTGKTQNLTHVSPKTGRAVCGEAAEAYKHKLLEIPAFLRGEGDGDAVDIARGLKLTGYFLIHRLLEQSGYQSLPDARSRLENVFNPVKMAE